MNYNLAMATDREDALKTWDDAWTQGLWQAPWSRALDELTPQQLVWTPSRAKHCIWQIINHVMFWRGVAVRRARGESVSEDEMKQGNFKAAPAASSQVLDELRERFAASHQDVRAAIVDPGTNLTKLAPLPYHDSYHIGQVMVLRAMQGMKPIE
jgi:hypothetical protein